MDRKVANNVIVGIFISLGFIAFLFMIFTMGGGTGIFSSQMTLYGKFSQVKGLHQGSEVSLSGLRIGVIKEIKVSDDATKDLIVQIGISKKYASTLRQDSTATIHTQGVLGDKYIEIGIGSDDMPLLKEGDFIKTAEQADLFTKSGNMITDISHYFDRGGEFGVLLGNLGTLSSNLANLTTQVEKQKGLLHELIYGTSGTSVNKSMAHLENILNKIDRGEGTIGSLINDPSIYEDVRSLLGGAQRSTILKYFMRQFIESGEKEKPK